ncbi:conserved hypothetical protein [Novosphingobium aromaticivorans DSM 12444]|jgi:hypothetical protein|uniref:DUF2274 domain-containing protein n=1 Tax=Novosphingobium aromaticivorans (strain ATCC 700278 / DSM 12444 / CCUG 56034 / CIP 105152 / NBRC 16084 / F199) TaxID=279238 RepID=Q2GBL7_NOVAD|nr:DUF2274 domain-containing protein [Novosphingobium aromaticivorans]ABD24756.1 conserved hypothetical protein [Novosphingobium aromaticivorans DSM 12444]SCY18607.1 hypothetical protein SAMN05660666_00958 [Novosphingobium aromaticivorans]
MTRLKLSDIADEKPVRLTIELPARLHRELLAYAAAVNGGDAAGAPTVERLIPPMLERFITSDRAFAKAKRGQAG